MQGARKRAGRAALSLLLCSLWLTVSYSSLANAEPIAFCHTGAVKLQSFEQHIENLRDMSRYTAEDIDGLIAMQRKGGPEFFSSQIIVQEEMSGSGTFDLRATHGLLDARQYRNITHWTCRRKDYPIVYFVGFRVRKIDGRTIFVARAPGAVNVISLRALDADLSRHVKVRDLSSRKVLCDDLGMGCMPAIFYERG